MAKTIEITLGKAGSITVDLDKVAKNQTVVDYIFNYGLKQMLNDVHASEKDAKAKLGLVQKKLDSLYAGQVAQARVGSSDPVGKLMKELAESDVKAALVKLGKKVKDIDKTKYAEIVAKQLDKKRDAYKATAEAKLAIKMDSDDSAADELMALLED